MRAEALRPTIRELRRAGFVSIKALAGELNERGIPAPRGGRWRLTFSHPTAGAPRQAGSAQAQQLKGRVHPVEQPNAHDAEQQDGKGER